MQLSPTSAMAFLAVAAAPAPVEGGELHVSFQPYNVSEGVGNGLVERAWQGCTTGLEMRTSDIDFIRDWLQQVGGSINVLPGSWLRRESGTARLCILNNDKNTKTFDNWEQGWVDNCIAHAISCRSTSNCYGGYAYLKDTTGTT